MPWYKSDVFDSEITQLMCERSIIEEGSINDIPGDIPQEQFDEWEKNGEIRWVETVRYGKGFFVTRRDWEFVK